MPGRDREIERSRPFMLVLLGERYGWIPPAERMQAAALEKGLAIELAGRSVTALEVEYGLLNSDPTQQQRSLFLLREPLDPGQILLPRRVDFSDKG